MYNLYVRECLNTYFIFDFCPMIWPTIMSQHYVWHTHTHTPHRLLQNYISMSLGSKTTDVVIISHEYRLNYTIVLQICYKYTLRNVSPRLTMWVTGEEGFNRTEFRIVRHTWRSSFNNKIILAVFVASSVRHINERNVEF